MRQNNDGYVLKPFGDNVGTCYDVMTDNDAVRQALGTIERNTNSNVLPYTYSGRPFSVTLRLDPNVRIYPGSYFVTEDGEIGISSSAYYKVGNTQTFLACPMDGIEWRVFEVIDIEFR